MSPSILEFPESFESADRGQLLQGAISLGYFQSISNCMAELRTVAIANWQSPSRKELPFAYLADVLVSQLHPRAHFPVYHSAPESTGASADDLQMLH